MKLVFEQIRVGGDRNFSYLLGDREQAVAAVVDPAFSPEEVVGRAQSQGLSIRYIINTHSHIDHINGNDRAKELTGAAIAAQRDSAVDADMRLDDKSTLDIGDLRLRVFHTPGHADDHLVLFVEKWNIALTGDLIFVGKVGGTADDESALTEWQSLQHVIAELPPATTIWPGHDYGCRPSSTMELELAANPFLLCKSAAEFLDLKRNWSKYKAEMGLR